jgi:hypothetical protein
MPRKTRRCGGQPISGSESSDEVEVEGVMRDHIEDKTLQLFETIANGKQQMAKSHNLLTQIMTQFITNNHINLSHGGANGNHAEGNHKGGRSHAKGRNTHILVQSILQTGNRKVPRPLLPPFLEDHPTRAHEQYESTDEVNTYFRRRGPRNHVLQRLLQPQDED